MKFRFRTLLSCVGFIAGLGSTTLAQAVIVVDANNNPGTNFVSLPAAVAAANEEDVLLIRPGTYSDTVIDGKSLVLQSSSPGGAFFGLTVLNLGTGQFLAVRDCNVTTALIKDCLGAVLLEGSSSFSYLIRRSNSVVLRNCIVFNFFGECDSGINVTNSNLYIYDSVVAGSTSNPLQCSGGPAVAQFNGRLFVHGSELTGGPGFGFGIFSCPGSGISLFGINPIVEILDSQVRAGSGGFALPIANFSQAGQVIQLPGIARVVSSAGFVKEGQSTSITYEGVAGDLVWLTYSSQPAAVTSFPQVNGYYHGLLPPTIMAVGAIPAGGTLVQPVTAPLLPPGVDVDSFYAQAFFMPSAEHCQFGSPTQVHLFDQRF